MKINRGIAICHYNRLEALELILPAVMETAPHDAKIVVCDDGSVDGVDVADCGDEEHDKVISRRISVESICKANNAILVKGPNAGVAANKNRALWALQDCHFIAILEDDLKPAEKGWFEQYEMASQMSGVHHFCRVQKRVVNETIPAFSAYMASNSLTPIYGPSPRGDFTFLTSAVLARVGAFNPKFRGAGYAHGEWSHRVFKAGLIPHPNKWIDIQEPNNKFVQYGDTRGGRWTEDEKVIKQQLKRNKIVYRELEKSNYTFHPLVLE